MLTSRLNKHVFWAPYGTTGYAGRKILLEGWYYWNEVGSDYYGPFSTEKLAIAELERYAEQLNKGMRQV